MRNLTNNINRINKKAENEKRRADVRKYRAIGREMLRHQDEIDKLNSMLHRMGVQMEEAMKDPTAVDAMYALIMARRDRAARAAEKRKKAAVERAEKRAAEKRAARAAVRRAATDPTVDPTIAAMVREMFDLDIE